ncbi:hypothetical protein J6590_107163, partial [Homalodisca vitripennis]
TGLINLENPYQLAIKQLQLQLAKQQLTPTSCWTLLLTVRLHEAYPLSLYGDSLKIVQLEIESPRGICSGAVCVPPHRSAYHYLPSARAIPATVPSSLTVSPYGGTRSSGNLDYGTVQRWRKKYNGQPIIWFLSGLRGTRPPGTPHQKGHRRATSTLHENNITRTREPHDQD